MKRQILAVSACVLLSGCGLGGEPSQRDIQSALVAFFSGPQSKLVDPEKIDLTGDGSWKQIVKSEKTACQKAEDQPGYSCAVRLSTCLEDDKPCTPVASDVTLHFVKAKTGWRLVPNGGTFGGLSRPIDQLGVFDFMRGMANGGYAGKPVQ